MRNIIPHEISAKFMSSNVSRNVALSFGLILLMILTPMSAFSVSMVEDFASKNVFASARTNNDSSNESETLTVLGTYENPSNGHTYHLLESANRSQSSLFAQSLGGHLVSINDAAENQWVVSTFTFWNGTPRHIWIGLSDYDTEGYWQWDAMQPSWYRNWDDTQPSMESGEDYAYISSNTEEGIQIGYWADSVNDPDDLTIHGLVEVGSGVDYAINLPEFEEESQESPAYGIVSDITTMNISTGITMEARVMPENVDGTQFIMMKGDYGWGMQLSDGVLHYANDYAIRNHPSAEGIELVENEWAHLAITVEEGIGGAFWIDGERIANISADDAVIPTGDFGSNSCFQSGDECDEFYIGRQGAGCDCNHYFGLLDDIRVWDRALTEQEIMNAHIGQGPSSNLAPLLHLDFDEGTGSSSWDQTSQLESVLHGVVWVDLDGNELNNPIQLHNGDDFWSLSGKEGTTYIYWINVPERVQFMNIEFWGWDGEATMYVRKGAIPDEHNNDYTSSEKAGRFDDFISWGYGQYTWPESGVYWIVIEGQTQFDNYALSLWWNEVPPPPPLDEMIELNNGMPVPGQDINNGEVSYYYIDLDEEVELIEIETYGGDGDGDLYVAYDADPAEWQTGDMWSDWGEPEGRQGGPNQKNPGLAQDDQRYANSKGPDNYEKVTLIAPIQGIWYIAVEAFEKVNDLNIVARFTYPPANADPVNSIELQPGIPFTPVSGNSNSDRHFHINTTLDVNRLEIQLTGGSGDADLFLSMNDVPSKDDYDAASSTFGNDEFIYVNSPLAGTYHILVSGWSGFEGSTITASFADTSDYVPEIKPIKLFNEEPVHNLRGDDGQELLFYVELESGIDSFSISLSNGFGNPNLFVESDSGQWQSTGRQTWESVWIESPDEGRYDITVLANSDFEGTSIVASWYDWGAPDIPDVPIDIFVDCKETANYYMDIFDFNNDGVVDEDEYYFGFDDDVWEDDWEFDEGEKDGWDEEKSKETSGRQRDGDISSDDMSEPVSNDDIFNLIDSDDDGELTYNELLLYACSCSVELEMAQELYAPMDEEDFAEFNWKNELKFEELDRNGNGLVDFDEFEGAMDSCETTWDPFDLDNGKDGGKDDSKSDDDSGDGILGTDYLANVDEEIVYSVVFGVVLLVAILLVIAFGQTRNGPAKEAWGDLESDIISRQTEAMLDNSASPVLIPDTVSNQISSPQLVSSTDSLNASVIPPKDIEVGGLISDLGFENDVENSSVSLPPSHIMGSLQDDGTELLEWPSGSGKYFTRSNFDAQWSSR